MEQQVELIVPSFMQDSLLAAIGQGIGGKEIDAKLTDRRSTRRGLHDLASDGLMVWGSYQAIKATLALVKLWIESNKMSVSVRVHSKAGIAEFEFDGTSSSLEQLQRALRDDKG